jgi:hypothetical protein
MLPIYSAQTSDPISITIKSSGSSYSDQFPASTDYAFSILQQTNPSLGLASFIEGTNTLKFMFTPEVGSTGTTDIIITYYTLSAPMHPMTKMYRIHVADEIVVATNDQYVVQMGSVDFPLAVLQNDSATSGPLQISTVSVLNTGSASICASGDSILFTPDPDFFGDTWIQYIVCDTLGNCSKASAHVLVSDPALSEMSYHKFLLNKEQLEILTPYGGYTVSEAPSSGELDSVSSFVWVYSPDSDFTGVDTFKLSYGPDSTLEYFVTVYDKVINAQARDDKFYVRPDLSVNFNVLNNDLLDFDLISHTETSKGTLTPTGGGSFTYTPNGGYRGVDKFTYTTCFQDTVYCETATVLIHVTDLEPDNVFSYKLQTSKNLPLAIDYPIIYTDFSYVISADPQHGILMDYVGLQTIEFDCDTVESYNMLVYEPEDGFTGADHFEYYYCVQPTNLCYLVKVDINVIEAPETESCPCVLDCVWPGDADLDGRVDMNDLLSIGYKLGETGLVRPYSDPSTWFGQHAEEWSFSDDPTGVQYKDANGDGSVTAADVEVIDQHYYKAHDVVIRDVQQRLPYQFSLIPVQFSLDSGDVVILDVSFGNSNVPVLDMMGAKFSINVPAWMLDSASVDVQFHQDSWLAEGSSSISLGKVPWDGRIDAGFSKANGKGASGYGVIATIVFIIEDDLEGFKSDDDEFYIPIKLEAGGSMGNDGTGYDVEGDEVVLTYKLNTHKPNDYKLMMYPNPAQDLVNIYLNGKTAIESVTIVDPQGRVIERTNHINLKQHQLNVSALPDGLYYIQVNHSHGVMTQLLSVIR